MLITPQVTNRTEHKSHNLLKLENGQYCLYPNNRMRVYDNSLTPDDDLTRLQSWYNRISS